jgi:hypothetical protein
MNDLNDFIVKVFELMFARQSMWFGVDERESWMWMKSADQKEDFVWIVDEFQ